MDTPDEKQGRRVVRTLAPSWAMGMASEPTPQPASQIVSPCAHHIQPALTAVRLRKLGGV